MKTTFIFFLSILICSFSFSQPKDLPSLIEDIVQAEKYHKKGLGHATNKSKNFKAAISYYDSAQQIREPILPYANDLPEEDRVRLLTGYIKSSHNIGVAYFYLEDLINAEKYTSLCISKQLEFQEKYEFLLPKRMGRAYCQLGKVYRRTKGFDEAYAQLKLSRNYLERVDPTPHGDLSLLENTLSNLFLIWEEADSLLIHSKNQYDLYTNKGDGSSSASALLNMGVGKEWKNELGESIMHYNEALDLLRKDSLNNRWLIAIIYRNRSYVFAKLKKWEEALNSVDIGLNINGGIGESIEVLKDRAELLMTKAYVYYLKKDFIKSIEFYEKAICTLIQETNSQDCNVLEKNILIDESFLSIDNRILLLGLGYRAKALALNKEFKKAKSAFDLAISFLNKIRREYNDTESKLKLTEIAKVIFEGAIALHLDPAAYNPTKAFAYAEQSKAFTLLEGVKHSKAMRIADIPEESLDQEYTLRAQIAQLERQYLAAETATEKADFLEEIRGKKDRLNALMSSLEENEVYQQLMTFESPAVKDIKRKALGKGQTLVEYFVGEEKTYVFIIPKRGRLQVLQLDIGKKELNQSVDAFWSSIYHYGCDEEVLKEEAPDLAAMEESDRKKVLEERYLEYGQQLFRQLFADVLTRRKGGRFVIVPDEGLSYLPFDALLTGPPERNNFSFYPFLGKEEVLSYAYSANLLLEMQGKASAEENRKILAIAPSFNSYKASLNKSTLDRLTNNKTEVEAICNIFSNDCQPYTGEGATRDTFLELVESNAYWIIHLSTHGKANDKDPDQSWISFTQNTREADAAQLLYASDLYGLPIRAELVVLSACETNKGRLRRGEGIMSFARGLSAAGVKSVLSTFWVIGEDPSLEVMKGFYEHLNAGDSKDIALQKARSALMDHSDFSHPYFWSAFVPIGKMVEVEPVSSWPQNLVLVGIGLLGVLLVSRRRRA